MATSAIGSSGQSKLIDSIPMGGVSGNNCIIIQQCQGKNPKISKWHIKIIL